ncbi:MAG: hypothetical protein HZY77_10985 [Thiobacillus sp.]|uniref:phage protease n=1 Tax=Thiobacillus sp. TaxID=924 RepID=UPI00168C17C6|nr:phage protease [Thiobacillus sp.]QLQ03231.1 MAG: hypothetical protein HZY77_10985 [Thiobacillus sp.]
MNHHAQAQCSTEQIVSAKSVFRLIPDGLFRASDGRPDNIAGWSISREAAMAIIGTANARANEFVIDYEHQSLNANRNGAPAPAAGWFKRMEWRDGDGLYVIDARWTDIAAKMIATREYRYISPVFTFDKSGNVSSILSAALTNTPALDGLTDLAAATLCRIISRAWPAPGARSRSGGAFLANKALAYQKEQAASGVYVTPMQAVNNVTDLAAARYAGSSVASGQHLGREAEAAALSLSNKALAYQKEQAAAGVYVTTLQAVNHVFKEGGK